MMTSADKTQAYALVATLVGTVVGFVCLQIPDRGEGADAFVGFLMALSGVVPLAVGLYESRKEKPSDAAGDEPASEKGPETVNYTNPMVDVDEDSSGSDDGSGDDDAT